MSLSNISCNFIYNAGRVFKSWELSFSPFCWQQAKHAHCQFFCWAPDDTRMCEWKFTSVSGNKHQATPPPKPRWALVFVAPYNLQSNTASSMFLQSSNECSAYIFNLRISHSFLMATSLLLATGVWPWVEVKGQGSAWPGLCTTMLTSTFWMTPWVLWTRPSADISLTSMTLDFLLTWIWTLTSVILIFGQEICQTPKYCQIFMWGHQLSIGWKLQYLN